jgi:hypothetical protein
MCGFFFRRNVNCEHLLFFNEKSGATCPVYKKNIPIKNFLKKKEIKIFF